MNSIIVHSTDNNRTDSFDFCSDRMWNRVKSVVEDRTAKPPYKHITLTSAMRGWKTEWRHFQKTEQLHNCIEQIILTSVVRAEVQTSESSCLFEPMVLNSVGEWMFVEELLNKRHSSSLYMWTASTPMHQVFDPPHATWQEGSRLRSWLISRAGAFVLSYSRPSSFPYHDPLSKPAVMLTWSDRESHQGEACMW